MLSLSTFDVHFTHFVHGHIHVYDYVTPLLGLILVTGPNAFLGSLFITLSLSMLCLKDPHTGNDTTHSELLPTIVVINWNKIEWVLATQRQEVSINN